MRLREKSEKKTSLVPIVAATLFVIALGFVIMYAMRGSNRAEYSGAYFYDMGSGTIFANSNSEPPPIPAPSGPYQGEFGGVRAYIYTCGECVDYHGMTVDEVKAEGGIIAWLETFNPEVKQKLVDGRIAGGADVIANELLVKGVNESDWVPAISPSGIRLRDTNGLCSDGQSKPCWPSR